MDNEKELELSENADRNQGAEDLPQNTEPERPTRGLEGFYENFRSVPLKYLDAFIIICVILLIAVVAFGIVKARI